MKNVKCKIKSGIIYLLWLIVNGQLFSREKGHKIIRFEGNNPSTANSSNDNSLKFSVSSLQSAVSS